MKTDVNGKPLQIGDKVHPLGRGSKLLYVIDLGETTAGVSGDKNATNCMGIKRFYARRELSPNGSDKMQRSDP